MKRLLKEPLLHFLLLGALIFAAFEIMAGGGAGEAETILVTQGRIESLATAFERTWQRPPSGEELDALIRDHVRGEVYYREALALGLDRDDTVIRNRLRQKLEFVSGDLAERAEPTEAELRAYLEARPGRFRKDDRLTFRHVFLDPDRRRGTLASDASKLLAALNRQGEAADVAAAGDPTLLPARLEDAAAGEVATQFGESFAEDLAALPVGRWQGPVESAYGVHLVRVSRRTQSALPALEDVRDEVRREWMNDRRVEAEEELYRALRGRYRVTIEQPEPEGADGKLARAAEAR